MLLPFIFCFAYECKIGLRAEQGLRYTSGSQFALLVGESGKVRSPRDILHRGK